jgi:hypothetical protein
MTPTTQLTVNVPELADAPSALVEVRDGNMKIVGRPLCGVPLDVAPGLYVASVTLPSGAEYRETVEVRAAEPVELVLGPAQRETTAAEAGFAVESAVVAADLSGSAVAAEAGSAVAAEAPAKDALSPQRCWVRLVSGTNGKPLADTASRLRPLGATAREVGPGIDLEYMAIPTDGVVFAQVATPGGVPQNVALPAEPGSAIARCRLHVLLGRRGIAATALPAARTSTALIASYLVTGNLRTAANVAEHAERMLASERDDAIGATLGAYALLRLGRGGRLPDEPATLSRGQWPFARRGGPPRADHWLRDLALRCEWLPDGAILAGELARRNGRGEEADAMMALALRRGLPMFSDGLSLLVSDLLTHTPGRLLRRRAARLLATSSFADYGQLGVVLPGIDPTRADDSAATSDFSAGDGWQPLERTS